MWQAISNLLSEQHTDGAEIELRNELPGGDPCRLAFTFWRKRLFRQMR